MNESEFSICTGDAGDPRPDRRYPRQSTTWTAVDGGSLIGTPVTVEVPQTYTRLVPCSPEELGLEIVDWPDEEVGDGR